MKRILSLLLAVMMLVSAVPTADATNIYQSGDTESATTQVVYTADNNEDWTVTVPAKLNPGQSGTVTLAGDWPDSKTISVTADKTVTLTNSIKATDTKTLNVNFDGISERGSNTGSQTFTENVSVAGIANALFGNWSGKFNYNVTSETKEPEVVPGATFDDGVTLTWDELKLAENGDKYGYNASGITDTAIDDFAFYNCNSLKSITIPEGITTIGDSVLSYCASLTSITIPDSITTISDYNFDYCTALTTINVDVDNQSYCSVDDVLYSKDMSTLVCYPAGKTGTSYTIFDSVTTIGQYAFCSCTSLTSIAIPEGVTTIGQSAFESCTSLESVDIPNSVTAIGQGAFGCCAALESIDLSDNITTIDGVTFIQCTSLKSITIPEGVTSIDFSAFESCTALESVDIPDSVTAIGQGAFAYCAALESITMPDSATTIGQWAFQDCTSLKSITIPKGVTTIGASTFSCCTSLTSITIPDSVTTIGQGAFMACKLLTTVNYTGTEEQWEALLENTDNSLERNQYLINATVNYNYVAE